MKMKFGLGKRKKNDNLYYNITNFGVSVLTALVTSTLHYFFQQ